MQLSLVVFLLDGHRQKIVYDLHHSLLEHSVGQAVVKAADATIAPGALAAVEIASGRIRNNRTEMKFEGVGRREFSFEFRMLPNNSKEAENIEKIVTAFRYHAMPEIEGSDKDESSQEEE